MFISSGSFSDIRPNLPRAQASAEKRSFSAGTIKLANHKFTEKYRWRCYLYRRHPNMKINEPTPFTTNSRHVGQC